METRNISRTQRDQAVPDPNSKKEPERTAKECYQETFDQQLLDDLTAGRADRCVNGKLSRPRGTSRGKQIREVRAGDEQDQPDRAQEQSEIGSVFAD